LSDFSYEALSNLCSSALISFGGLSHSSLWCCGTTTLGFALLSPANTPLTLELPPNTWHTVLPQQQNSVILEVKQGPFNPSDGCDFAPWAPKEGEPAVADFLRWAHSALLGECFV